MSAAYTIVGLFKTFYEAADYFVQNFEGVSGYHLAEIGFNDSGPILWYYDSKRNRWSEI
jgi:hypothetical protein